MKTMPIKRTSKPAPARKARAAKARPKAVTATKAAAKGARPASASAGKADASLRELALRLGRIELAGLAGQLVKGWREDIAVIVKARRRSYAGLQAVVGRQCAQIAEAIGEWRTVGKLMVKIGPRQSLSHADKLAVASFRLALADIRELADLAASSQREAFEILQRQVHKNIDEVQRLLSPSAPSA
jgi:phasin family protein